MTKTSLTSVLAKNSADMPKTPIPSSEARILKAGPLEAIYLGGDIRYIKKGKIEIIRRIYQAVRDRNWETISPVITNEEVSIKRDSFYISYDAVCQKKEIHFQWTTSIEGTDDGKITFLFDGTALSTFFKNRIGICVHHPIIGLAGTKCRISKRDQTLEDASFPELISPYQPFLDLGILTYEVQPGLKASLKFEGEAFETEDQRNWMDGSYKTYSTPLSLPYPVEIKKGEKVCHKFELLVASAEKSPSALNSLGKDGIHLSLEKSRDDKITSFGLCINPDEKLTEVDTVRLRRIQPSHLRVDVKFQDPSCYSHLLHAMELSKALSAPLEVALHLSENAEQELKLLEIFIDTNKPQADVSRWLVFHQNEKVTTPKWVELCKNNLCRQYKQARFALGTNAYFAELNRNRPVQGTSDAVCFSVNAQVHASDTLSIAETLEAIPYLIQSARSFCGTTPLVISPITLKPRFNPNATAPKTHSDNELPDSLDQRQTTLFAAAWTAGVLKQLFESKVEFATFYKTSGWEGILESSNAKAHPLFPIAPAIVFPMYHLFADIAEYKSGQYLPIHSDECLKVDAFGLEMKGSKRIFIYNLTATCQTANLAGVDKAFRIRRLNESTVSEAMKNPEAYRLKTWELCEPHEGVLNLRLTPNEIVCIDIL